VTRPDLREVTPPNRFAVLSSGQYLEPPGLRESQCKRDSDGSHRGCWNGLQRFRRPGQADRHLGRRLGERRTYADRVAPPRITTAWIVSCGLLLGIGDPEDMADTFCWVEGILHDQVPPVA
jgi:hypothetical protein